MSKDCGCGRSPTGKCIGWHGLTNEQYIDKLAEYNERKMNEALNKEPEKKFLTE